MYAEQIRVAEQRLERLGDDKRQSQSAIDTQTQRVTLALAAVERNLRLREDKFVSDVVVQEKRADLLDQQSRLHDLQRSRNAIEREILGAVSELKSLPLKASAA